MRGDFSRTAGDYGRYRPVFPDAFFERLSGFGIGLEGQRALDLGAGTGSLARAFAARGCRVTGLDVSEAMLEEAERLDHNAGISVSYSVANAEATGLPDNAFEMVTAGQCWHWFDRSKVAKEVLRVLVPGGSLVICHLDPIPLPGNLMKATGELIGRHNPQARDTANQTGFYPDWLEDVAVAGFEDIQTFTFDVSIPHSHERWRGRMKASAAIGIGLEPGQVASFEAELATLLREHFPIEPLEVPHRIFALVCKAS